MKRTDLVLSGGGAGASPISAYLPRGKKPIFRSMACRAPAPGPSSLLLSPDTAFGIETQKEFTC